ncbi:NADH-dependent [FeFe] hydrogenase, group A6 [Vallitalea okinawensis]|uniref:NADH-dependent [FeFe] hydrogenase, group A6 n=1 Tax=Vallitalea okinawensis TaxID=2078660 RepID=UPI000CFD6BF9|nr:NADH-dependent [FeFe] hydrogenase, group A6 [Vallitalea okinawensis]
MSEVKIIIDGKEVQVPAGSTVLEAARKIDIDIPTLCHLDLHDIKMVNKAASCRICVVEVEGRRNLAPACATPVVPGMVVKTNTIRVLEARKTVLELLLSDHPKDCLVCAKSGNCDLQDLAIRFGVRDVRITGKAQSEYVKDLSPSIIRDMDKCIMCRRCETMCNEVQTVGVLSGINRGFDAVVSTSFEVPLEDSTCTYCGQCVQVCPVGALTEKDHSWEVVEALADPDKVVVVQTAPAVRVALGEEFGYEAGTIVTGQMAAALRKMGFDYVFDTDFAADLTIMEEATELVDRLTRHLNGEDVPLPLLTSCCPAWVNFIETQFPELLDIPSSARSPQQMFGAIAKSYFAEKIGVPREKMVVVSIMPCLAKKYEATRDEFSVNGNPDVDYSLSTRELASLIKRANFDLADLAEEDFDNPLGESTGAGVIFGKTGGVIEAATRTAYEWVTGEKLEKVEFHQLRDATAEQGIRVAEVAFGELVLNIGIASGLGNTRMLLEEVKNGNPRNLHAIEIMACPGGCINGGGQPYHHGKIEVIKKRTQGLLKEDEGKAIRKSHENPDIVKLYEEYLTKPGSEKAHHLLHTHYNKKERV